VIHVLQVLVVQVPDVSVFVILVKGDSKAVGNVKDASETENYNTYKTSTGTYKNMFTKRFESPEWSLSLPKKEACHSSILK
jgi:hypothetical protein